MIGRRVITKPGELIIRDFGMGKTLAIAVRSNTSSCAYALRLIVDGQPQTLQELVLTGVIMPTVLVYQCYATSSFAFSFADLVKLYTGDTTNTVSYPDWAIILCLKAGHVYSGMELYSRASLTSADRGLEAYLFDGAFSTTLSGDAETIDQLNQTADVYTMSNIVSVASDLNFGVSPSPSAPVYKYVVGNSLVRACHDSEGAFSGVPHIGRGDIFGLYWLMEDNTGEFLMPTSLCHMYASDYAVWRMNVSSGTNHYLFSVPLYFE